LERAKAVGAVGAVVSTWMSTDCVVETLPTLSIVNHLTVWADETWNDAVVLFTVVAVPLDTGSLPSVV